MKLFKIKRQKSYATLYAENLQKAKTEALIKYGCADVVNVREHSLFDEIFGDLTSPKKPI